MFNSVCIKFGLLLFSTLLLSAASNAQLVDPMRPAGVEANAASRAPLYRDKWELESTIISGDSKSAIVSGSLYHIGDKVSGAWLLEISPGAVAFELQGRRFMRDLQAGSAQPIKKYSDKAPSMKGTP